MRGWCPGPTRESVPFQLFGDPHRRLTRQECIAFFDDPATSWSGLPASCTARRHANDVSAARTTTKAVSLSAELAMLARAVQGLARFLDAEEGGGVTEDHRREAVALLGLLGAHLWLLPRAVVGAQDPKSLLATFNEEEPPRPGDDPDILLRAWSEDAARPSRRKGV